MILDNYDDTGENMSQAVAGLAPAGKAHPPPQHSLSDAMLIEM
jgi:hypothetical protein